MRRCLHCGEELVRRAGEDTSHWLARSCCNVRCANRHRLTKPVPPARTCVGCGAVISRYRPSGVRMDPGAYSRRKYCSRACKDATQVVVERPVVAVVAAPVGEGVTSLLRAALRNHPELIGAFSEVERDVSLDSWEPYHRNSQKVAA